MTEEDDKVTILQAQSLTLKTSKNQREKKEKRTLKNQPLISIGSANVHPFFNPPKKTFIFLTKPAP